MPNKSEFLKLSVLLSAKTTNGWNTSKNRWPLLNFHHWASILRFLRTIWFLLLVSQSENHMARQWSDKNEAHQSIKGQKLIVFINGKRTNHNEMFSRKLSTFCQSLCQRQAVPRFTCLAFFSPTFSAFLYNQQSFPYPMLDIWCSFLASLHILHFSLQSLLNPTLNAQCFFLPVW